MGDVRFDEPYRQVKEAADRVDAMSRMSDEELIAALGGASREKDPLLANVLATAVLNRHAQLRSVFDHMGEGAALLGRDTRTRLVNAAFQRILGWTHEDLRDKRAHDVLHPHCRVGARCPLVDTFLDGPGAQDDDAVFTRKDGARVPVAYTISPLRKNDEFLGAVLLVRDMTSHKLNTEALARLAAIVSNSSDAIHTKTTSDIITSWNEGAQRLYGYTPSEAIGSHVNLIVPEDRRGEVHIIDELVHKQGQAITLETRRRTKDGRIVDVSVSLTPIRDDRGRILGSTVITRDITTRKREHEIVKAALEAAPAAMIAVDEPGRIILANAQAEAMFGYEKGELDSHLVEELIPESLRAGHSLHRTSFATKPHKRPMGAGLELHARRKDGAQFRVEVSLTPVLSRGPEGLVVIAAIREIPERAGQPGGP